MLRLRVHKESASWVVVDKPAGFHTHPPEDKSLRINPRFNALGILEKQLGQSVYPMHRLDRAASGLLLYSRDKARNAYFQQQFAANSVKKTYFVVVRGEIREPRIFSDPLKTENGLPQDASTGAEPCFTFELPLEHPHGGHRRFTVLSVQLGTGRFHQIRRHFAQAGYPVIGDKRHGDRKLNREFAALTGCDTMFLRCMDLEFTDGEPVRTQARWSREWHRLFEIAGCCASPALG